MFKTIMDDLNEELKRHLIISSLLFSLLLASSFVLSMDNNVTIMLSDIIMIYCFSGGLPTAIRQRRWFIVVASITGMSIGAVSLISTFISFY